MNKAEPGPKVVSEGVVSGKEHYVNESGSDLIYCLEFGNLKFERDYLMRTISYLTYSYILIFDSRCSVSSILLSILLIHSLGGYWYKLYVLYMLKRSCYHPVNTFIPVFFPMSSLFI